MANLRFFWVLAAAATVSASAQDFTFFESNIRPVLANKCYGCHSSTMAAPMGGLRLDTKAGMLAGGIRGHAVVPGEPENSLLLEALRYTNHEIQMPPSGKLADAIIGDFERWIAS